MKNLRHELSAYKDLQDRYHETALWVLNTSLSAGDTVSEADFNKVIFQTQDQTELTLFAEPKDVAGYAAKTSLSKGSIATKEMFYQANELTDDVRFVEASDLILPENLKEKDYVDLRLRFPNGEDYIVVSHKKLKKLLSDDNGIYGILLELDEGELLRLSSARVDRDIYDNCSLYVLPYRMDFQEPSVKDYPVNPDVFELMQWDPNILNQFTVKEEQKKRTNLETHLEVFLQQEESDTGTTTETDDTSTDSITIYQPQTDET